MGIKERRAAEKQALNERLLARDRIDKAIKENIEKVNHLKKKGYHSCTPDERQILEYVNAKDQTQYLKSISINVKVFMWIFFISLLLSLLIFSSIQP